MELLNWVGDLVWGPPMLILLVGTGVFLTFRLRGLQFTKLLYAHKLIFTKDKESAGDISHFQALTTALAATIGTGNIAGVATAIFLGGPGAVFWMWVIAFLGASSAYIEAALAQVYKDEVDEQYRGGPQYFIEKGLGIKWYAVAFSVATVVAMGFFLPGIQSNAIAVSMQNAFSIGPAITGGVIVILLALILFGGVKRIGRVAEKVVPVMAIIYILVALVMMLSLIHISEPTRPY